MSKSKPRPEPNPQARTHTQLVFRVPTVLYERAKAAGLDHIWSAAAVAGMTAAVEAAERRSVPGPAEAVQFVRDFVALSRGSDTNSEDECHALQARAEAILAQIDRP